MPTSLKCGTAFACAQKMPFACAQKMPAVPSTIGWMDVAGMRNKPLRNLLVCSLVAVLPLAVSCAAEPDAESQKGSAAGESCVKTADCDGVLRCVGNTCVAADAAGSGSGADGTSTDTSSSDGGPTTTDTGPANHPPIATDDSANVSSGDALILTVLYNDGDYDGDKLTIQSTTQGAHGSVSIIYGGTMLRYQPTSNGYTGSDTFEYTIADGHGGTDTATVTMQYKQVPTLEILTPKDGATLSGGKLTVTFKVTGCAFTTPKNSKAGCHAHASLDGKKGPSTYAVAPLKLTQISKGNHEFRLQLHKNDGTDGPWSPPVIAKVTFAMK